MGKYVDFNGRAALPEYWWFFLFTVLLTWFADIADPSKASSTIVSLALLLPSLSAATRRLHDTDRSGWWQLIALTVIGLIPLFIWLASKGNDQSNEYKQTKNDNNQSYKEVPENQRNYVLNPNSCQSCGIKLTSDEMFCPLCEKEIK